MGDEGGDGTGGFEELPTEIEGVIGVWVEAVTVVILTVVIGVEYGTPGWIFLKNFLKIKKSKNLPKIRPPENQNLVGEII